MNHRVFVTGASGFMGQHLCSFLESSGRSVTRISRATAPPSNEAPWIQLEAEVSQTLARIWEGNSDYAVVHTAGRINGNANELFEGNEGFTAKVVETLAAANPSAPFVYVSSVSAIEQKGEYGRSKHRCEEIVRDSDLSNYAILRPSLLYGRHDTKNVSTLIALATRYPIVPVPGRSVVRLQPLYIDDFCAAVDRLLGKGDLHSEVYTLAGPKQEYLWDMVGEIQRKVGKHRLRLPVPLWILQRGIGVLEAVFPFLPWPVQQIRSLHGHPPFEYQDAERDLGFRPRSFRAGLNCMLGKTRNGPSVGSGYRR